MSTNNSSLQYKLNKSELFIKYKSSYILSFFDLCRHSFYVLYAFYLLWYFKNTYFVIITIPLLSLLHIKTFTIFHDCCHNSYSPSKILNYIISHITGAITFTSPNWILDHHIHHMTNGNKENKYNYKFNELIDCTEKEYINMPEHKKMLFNLFYNYKVYFTLFPFLYFVILQRFIYIIKKLKYKNKISKTFTEIICDHLINNILIVICLYFLSIYNIHYHFIISQYLASILGFILFNSQHTFNPPYAVNNNNWNMTDSGILGSSFIQIPNYLKYFLGEISYHHIHHLNSKIPAYNLQKYHEEVISKSNMFDNIIKLSIYDCYNNLKLRLYSEKRNKYIRLDEVQIGNNEHNKYLHSSKILYYTNILLYGLLQIPVLIIGIPLYPFYGQLIVHKLYCISLFILDKLFLQVDFLNELTVDKKPCIILLNHSSCSDGYLMHFSPDIVVSVVKNEIFYYPLLGQVFWMLDYIFVKRDDKTSRNNTKNKMIENFKKNTIVQICPQGKIEQNKYFRKNEIILKKGSIEIAIQHNIPIILVYHNIGDKVDDFNYVMYLHKKIYAIRSNSMLLPSEYNELPLEKKVDIFYKIIYDEFTRLEKIVLDKVEMD